MNERRSIADLARDDVAAILEALLFSAEKPLSVQEMVNIFVQQYEAEQEAAPKQGAEAAHEDVADGEDGAEQATHEQGGASLPDEHPGEEVQDEDAGLLPFTQQMLVTRMRQRVYDALDYLKKAYNAPRRRIGRGFSLIEVAGGWTLRTDPHFGTYIRRFKRAKPIRLSRAALECLSIIAYQQPVTKPQVDAIRGVDSSGVVKSLLERGLVRVLGRKEEPGRPLLYGTSKQFLSFFNLKGLSDLPTLRDLEELSGNEAQISDKLFVRPDHLSLQDVIQPFTAAQDDGAELIDGIESALQQLNKQRRHVTKVLEEQAAEQVGEQEQAPNAAPREQPGELAATAGEREHVEPNARDDAADNLPDDSNALDNSESK